MFYPVRLRKSKVNKTLLGIAFLAGGVVGKLIFNRLTVCDRNMCQNYIEKNQTKLK